MRTTSATLCLLFLSACATTLQDPDHSVLRPRPKILHVNGTLEPVTFAVDHRRAVLGARGAPCQTNDPMPTGALERPIPHMPRSHPLRVAPMPNFCPVTAPLAGTSVITSVPLPLKTAPAPTPTEPQP